MNSYQFHFYHLCKIRSLESIGRKGESIARSQNGGATGNAIFIECCFTKCFQIIFILHVRVIAPYRWVNAVYHTVITVCNSKVDPVNQNKAKTILKATK